MERTQSLSLLCIIRKGRVNKREQYPVYLRLTVAGIRAEMATNVLVTLDKWNATKGRLKGTVQEIRTSNHLLDNFENRARNIYNKRLLDGTHFTAESIKHEILGVEEKQYTLVAMFEQEISQMQLKEGNGFTIGTIKNWKVTLRHLKEFLKDEYKTKDIFFKEVDEKFISKFDTYARVKWICRTNAILKHFQRIRKIVRMAVNGGWLQKDPFNNYRCKQEATNRTFLTPDELKKIETKTFSLRRLENVKDIFIFSCYTGLSFVDIENLTVNNLQTGIDGKKWVYTFRQKTNSKSNIPLLQPALRLIEKYADSIEASSAGSLFPVINNSKTNSYLKEIADLCGIQKNLTFHMARHTFATTVTLSNGVPIETVSKMLGHTKITTTQIYAKVLENKVSADMNALELKLLTS